VVTLAKTFATLVDFPQKGSRSLATSGASTRSLQRFDHGFCMVKKSITCLKACAIRPIQRAMTEFAASHIASLRFSGRFEIRLARVVVSWNTSTTSGSSQGRVCDLALSGSRSHRSTSAFRFRLFRKSAADRCLSHVASNSESRSRLPS